ncbi:hypothetical protein PILCRDRAFT_814137 [Piloderma croceum F 1598]|uniref:Uncharacterized protein n=1 Tax=Piloderma croceum (strain F 1598) TaxID=765440 RepID=A0A0C3CES6_PILCF|nr:hypothetical protein PILCRDRAFT_814137 [Piloderma croceum F 1598]
MSLATQPCLNPNPDIAGIGVRVSIYIQAFLNLACTFVFAKDGKISSYESATLSTSSTNLFLTGCALLISAFIQGATSGFSVHHALIILNISWINSFSAILFVTLGVVLSISFTTWFEPGLRQLWTGTLLRAIPLSILHLSGMGALGIWVWAKVNTFGDQLECTPATFMTIFGHDIAVTSASLRKGSIVLYSIITLPLLNLVIIILVGVVMVTLLSLAYYTIHGSFEPWESFDRFILVSGGLTTALLEVLFIVDTELMISRSSTLVKPGESAWTFGQTLAMVMVAMLLLDTVRAGFKSWTEKADQESGEKPDEKVNMV